MIFVDVLSREIRFSFILGSDWTNITNEEKQLDFLNNLNKLK